MAKSKDKEEKKGQKQSARATEEHKVSYSVNHPVRLDVVSILFERVASPNEMADQLRVALGNVSFHVTELVKDRVIELVKTEQRRGAIEHYYRACTRPEISNEELKKMPKATRRKMAALHIQAIVAEGLASLKHGKMDADDDLNLIWMPMALDEEGREKVSKLQAEMFEQLEAIKAKHSVPQEEGKSGPPMRIAAMMWFERGGIARSMPPLPVD